MEKRDNSSVRSLPLLLIFSLFLSLGASCGGEKIMVLTDPVWWRLYGEKADNPSSMEQTADRMGYTLDVRIARFTGDTLVIPPEVYDSPGKLIVSPLLVPSVFNDPELSARGGVALLRRDTLPPGWMGIFFDYTQAYEDAGRIFAEKAGAGVGGKEFAAGLFADPGGEEAARAGLKSRIDAFHRGLELFPEFKTGENRVLIEKFPPEETERGVIKKAEVLLEYEPLGIMLSCYEFTPPVVDLCAGLDMVVIVEDYSDSHDHSGVVDYSMEVDWEELFEEAFKAYEDGSGIRGKAISLPAVLSD